MIELFPNKRNEFKEIVYSMFEEVEEEECEEGFKVLDIILMNYGQIAKALFVEGEEQWMEEAMVKYLINYCVKI